MNAQRMASPKIILLTQLIGGLISSSEKAIICSHFPQILTQLKMICKETGIACFMIQRPILMDTVDRFNRYRGAAVFLHEIGNSWKQSECALFELDKVQNIISFDYKATGSDSDLL